MTKTEKDSKARAELRLLEGDLEQCRQGLSRLECSRDLLEQNMEAVKRWQQSFSEPLERYPGGAELLEQTDAEAQKSRSRFQELYDSARSECLETQRRLEAKIDAKKKGLAAAEAAPREKEGGKADGH